ncbi:MAG: acyltransferase [Ruminococcaceae bacterium]|nr:acyltransferase [Oscillospiraceae bacterium]
MKNMIKGILRFFYYLPSNFSNRIRYKLKGVRVGKKHETKGNLCIKNKGTITIGDRVRINSKGSANPIGGGEKTYFQVLSGAKLTIGNDVGMSNCAITAGNSVTIGDYVRIGAGVKIYDTDFHSLNPFERTAKPEIANVVTKPVMLEDYAFIGAGSYILKGVTVGKYSIIGAGSVVTKDVPQGEIWAGNPAKKIGIVPLET